METIPLTTPHYDAHLRSRYQEIVDRLPAGAQPPSYGTRAAIALQAIHDHPGITFSELVAYLVASGRDSGRSLRGASRDLDRLTRNGCVVRYRDGRYVRAQIAPA